MAKVALNSLRLPRKPKAPKANASAASWDKYEKRINAYNLIKKAINNEKARREKIRAKARQF